MTSDPRQHIIYNILSIFEISPSTHLNYRITYAYMNMQLSLDCLVSCSAQGDLFMVYIRHCSTMGILDTRRNEMPTYIQNQSNYNVQLFKGQLDMVLTAIPNEPQIPEYMHPANNGRFKFTALHHKTKQCPHHI